MGPTRKIWGLAIFSVLSLKGKLNFLLDRQSQPSDRRALDSCILLRYTSI